jgi:anti-sigma B factor antagonist
MNLILSSRLDGAVTVLTVAGEIDVATAPELRERIVELVNGGVYNLVIDMAAVEFCDSTGLGVLVGGLKRVRSHDGSLTLINVRDSVRRLFELTKLTDAFGIDGTLSATS